LRPVNTPGCALRRVLWTRSETLKPSRSKTKAVSLTFQVPRTLEINPRTRFALKGILLAALQDCVNDPKAPVLTAQERELLDALLEKHRGSTHSGRP